MNRFKLALLVLALFYSLNVFSQNKEINIAIGNYESLQIGMIHQKPKVQIGYGLGTDFNIYNQGWYFQASGFIGKSILKKHITKLKKHIDLKSFVWNIENPSNIFSAVSVNPRLRIVKNINSQWQLHAFAGLVWTSVFRYKRKTYTDVGFPKEWQPGFGFSLSKSLVK